MKLLAAVRRRLAELIDPTRAAEHIADLHQITALRVELASETVAAEQVRRVQAETIDWLEAELARSYAAVAAQLEVAAACPCSHTTDDPRST